MGGVVGRVGNVVGGVRGVVGGGVREGCVCEGGSILENVSSQRQTED